MRNLLIVVAVLSLSAAVGQCEVPTPTPGLPTPTPCAPAPDCPAIIAPLETRLAVVESDLRAFETLAYRLEGTAVACWDCWDLATLTAAAPPATTYPTYTPQATYTPRPTYTPVLRPTPTETPEPTPAAVDPDVMCRVCVTADDCAPGYECRECAGALRCVRAYYPSSDCNNYCVTYQAGTK